MADSDDTLGGNAPNASVVSSSSEGLTPHAPTQSLAIAASLISTILSSYAWVTEQEAVLALSPLAVASISMLMGSAILLMCARLTQRLPSWETMLSEKRTFLVLLISRTFVGQIFVIYALTATSASKIMFLTKVEPYLIVFWVWLTTREGVSRYHLFLLAIHIVGAVLLSTGGTFTLSVDQLGDLLVFAGVAANAVSYVPAQRLAKRWGAYATSGWSALIGGTVLFPIALLLEPNPFIFTDRALVGWTNLIVTVIIFYVLSTVLWYYSLTGLKAWMASAIRCVGPVVAAPIAYLFYEQALTGVQIFGAVVVLLTSVLMVSAKDKATRTVEVVEKEGAIAGGNSAPAA